MLKVYYRVDYHGNTEFVSRWFWQSPLTVYEKAKKIMNAQYINSVHVERVY